MNKVSHEISALISAREKLCQQICLIKMRVRIHCLPLIHCSTFSNQMKTNCICFIIQCAVQNGDIAQHRLVFFKKQGSHLNWNVHHAQLVSKTAQIIAILLHCTEFTAKIRTINRILFLAEPITGCTLQMDNEPCPRSPRLGTSCMVSVDLGTYFCLILPFKLGLINWWISRIKHPF